MDAISFQHSPSDYSRLPTLGQAIKKFDQCISQNVLETEICDLFEGYNVAQVYGISLLHRHFDMTPNEILVEHGPTSTPWPVPSNPLNFMDGRIVPRSWYFPVASGEPRPYEFGFERHDEAIRPASADPDLYGAFVTDLCEILNKHSLTSVLGLVALSPDYLPTEVQTTIKCEKTFGRANVVFEVGAEALNEKDKRTSIWTFGKFTRGGRELMLCFSGCICDDES